MQLKAGTKILGTTVLSRSPTVDMQWRGPFRRVVEDHVAYMVCESLERRVIELHEEMRGPTIPDEGARRLDPALVAKIRAAESALATIDSLDLALLDSRGGLIRTHLIVLEGEGYDGTAESARRHAVSKWQPVSVVATLIEDEPPASCNADSGSRSRAPQI
jgi:hypothetical protein